MITLRRPKKEDKEKDFAQSVRETVEGTLERIQCIRTISYLMAMPESLRFCQRKMEYCWRWKIS